MPFGIITSTANTFGTISGDVGSNIPGTLSGSVGVPGPQGPTGSQGPQGIQGVPGVAGAGVAAGGTTGQYLVKTSNADYVTGWSTLSLSGYLPLAGGTMNVNAAIDFSDTTSGTVSEASGYGFLVSSAANGNLATSVLFDRVFVKNATSQTTLKPTGVEFPDATLQVTAGLSPATAASTYQTLAGMSSYLTTSAAASTYYLQTNPSGFITSSALTPYLTTALAASTYQTLAGMSSYAPIASPVFTGDARAVTATLGDNDTSIATTAFVQAALAGSTAIAKSLEVEVRNQSGASIPAGSVVYISGATGNKPLITLSQANNDANSAQTMGFTKTAIANNATGFVIVRGECENLNTSGLTEGVQLYLSPTVAGAYTTTKPSAPQHLVYVGIVIRSHPTLGTILVAVQNGYELNELHDVAINSVADNNLLAYESSTTLWKNKSFSTLGLLTSATAATTYYLQSNPASYQTVGDLSAALSAYLLSSTAASTYYPLVGNPSNFLTSAPVTSVAGMTGAVVLANTDISGLGTMATATAADYSTTTVANGLYYPLSGNPSLFLTDAPSDGSTYGRNNGAWAVVSGGGGFISSVSSPLAVASGNLTVDLSAYATLASPSLTGTPLSTTAAADTTTTQISTTAFVIGQASSTTPAATGTAAIGTSLKYARADHVHANPLPPNGSAAQVLSKIDGTSYNVQWVTPSGGGGAGTDYQAYTTAGTFTWTKPAGAKWVEIWLYGAGGGGGSGARYATASNRSGGGGGSGGSYLVSRLAASGLGATETVVVGAGGLGGVSQTVNSTNGLNGANGANTSFSIFTAVGGALGQAGSSTVGAGGTGRTGYAYLGNASASGSGAGGTTATGTTANALVSGASSAASGGGGGGGAAAASTMAAAGGNGGLKTAAIGTAAGLPIAIAGGAGGTTGGTLATTGVPGNGLQGGGTGGGAGAYLGSIAAGTAGAVGAAPGGGGGGGGASNDGFASGAGGAGGPGVAYIITYC
jgi:hypothetical protein